jgi:DNA polymerase-3 subunit gamma/tau
LITESGSDLKQLALAILQHLRDLTVVKLTGSRDALLDMSDDLYEQLCEQANEVEATIVSQHFDRFARVVDSLENSRVPRLVIEMGLLELCNAEPLLPLGDLVARLDALASGRGGGGDVGGGGGRRAPATRGNLRAEPAAAPPAVFAAPAAQPMRPEPIAPSRPGADFEQLAREAGLLPSSTPPTRQHPPTRTLELVQPAPEKPAPAAIPDAFALTNEPLQPTPQPADCDVGCPSSRFTPRDAIAWRELEPWDAWESFLLRIRGEMELLDAVLAESGFVHIHDGKITLAAPATGFSQTQLRENQELRTAFERLTAEYFGESMRLELVDAPPTLPDSPSLTLVEAEREQRHREETARDAERHPRIRSLLGAFGGQLLEVEPLARPSLPPVGQRGLPEARS